MKVFSNWTIQALLQHFSIVSFIDAAPQVCKCPYVVRHSSKNNDVPGSKFSIACPWCILVFFNLNYILCVIRQKWWTWWMFGTAPEVRRYHNVQGQRLSNTCLHICVFLQCNSIIFIINNAVITIISITIYTQYAYTMCSFYNRNKQFYNTTWTKILCFDKDLKLKYKVLSILFHFLEVKWG